MNPLPFYRTLVILNGAVPLLILAWDAYRSQLGANPVNNSLHITGILSLLFLFLSLFMTPLRWATGWSGWIAFRRALGLYGFFYSLVHLAIYVGFDRAMNFSSTVHEMWTRRFLQVGTLAVILMVPLAVTSTNSMIQRIGPKRWKSLHQIAYLVASLGVAHYYLLVKSDVRQPIAFGTVLFGLLGLRFGRHYLELKKAAKHSASKTTSTGGIRNSISTVSSGPTKTGVVGPERSSKQWKGELKIVAIFQETHDVKTFRFGSVDGKSFPFAYQPGQFLNIQLVIDGKRVNRSYTIASSPTRSQTCELSIKREPMGLASRHMHDEIKVGDLLKVSGPSGRFTFTGEESNGVLLVAGGIGITPLMSILRYLTDHAWDGDIYFLNVARTENDLVFHDEIEWMKARFPRLRVCTTLTRTSPESMWMGDRGRATETLLRRFVPELTTLPVYLCGPNEMMDATRVLLMEMGVPDDLIHTEAFASKKANTQAAQTETENEEPATTHEDTNREAQSSNLTTEISFRRSMLRSQVTMDVTVLEAAEANSIDLPYECRAGICGQCKTRLIEGKVTMDCEDALSTSEKARGLILACQARAQTNLVVEA